MGRGGMVMHRTIAAPCMLKASLMKTGGAKSSSFRRSPAICTGFTLVELMIGLVVLTILVGIAIPSYQGLIANQRVRATTTDMHSSLILARSEAIKRNRQVIVTPAAGGWSSGWKITPVGGTALLDKVLTGGVGITGGGIGAAAFTYTASGRLSASGTFQIKSNADATKLTCLSLGIDGRVSSAKGGC